MSSQATPPNSPWARPSDDGGRSPDAVIAPVAAAGQPATGPIPGRGQRSGDAPIPGREPLGPLRSPAVSQPWVFDSGTVTGASLLPPARPAALGFPVDDGPLDPSAARRKTMMWFGGGAAIILAAGIVVILAMVLVGRSPFPEKIKSAPDTRPILAKLCPPPSGADAPPGAVPAVPAGPRTVDSDSGISYKAYGDPWMAWDMAWQTGGELGVVFRTGQFFETEEYPGGDYLATILSGSVPAASNDALTLDLKCAGAQVAADVRNAYYPQPNTMDPLQNKATTLGGRPAWLTEFRLHFHVQGLKATDELVAVALIDVGKPNASILYISIPGTHAQYDYVIDELLASVRPT